MTLSRFLSRLVSRRQGFGVALASLAPAATLAEAGTDRRRDLERHRSGPRARAGTAETGAAVMRVGRAELFESERGGDELVLRLRGAAAAGFAFDTGPTPEIRSFRLPELAKVSRQLLADGGRGERPRLSLAGRQENDPEREIGLIVVVLGVIRAGDDEVVLRVALEKGEPADPTGGRILDMFIRIADVFVTLTYPTFCRVICRIPDDSDNPEVERRRCLEQCPE